MSSSSGNVSTPGLSSGSSAGMFSLPPLDNTLGAILVAEILVSMLFGMTTLQIYIYFNRNPRDNSWMKGAVSSGTHFLHGLDLIFSGSQMIALWILDALHPILTSHTLYHCTVLNFMNPLALTTCPWSFALSLRASPNVPGRR
ncbi:hypothetical protein BC629DRAFT_1440174 [Irpex lacteus]|nr:hypothetical protein BC629DRAFT_1440174 [Irpex lacteus]